MRDGHTEGGQDTTTAPGFAVLTGTVLGVAVLLCVHLDWAPFVQNPTGPDQLVGLLIGGLLLSVCLLVWAIKTLYLLGRARRWSWKVAAVPVVVLAGLVTGLVLRPASFDSAQEDVAVAMLRETGPSTRRDLSFGGLEISLVDGFVGSAASGWVYSPGAEPVATGDRRFEKLSGDWYSLPHRAPAAFTADPPASVVADGS
ncbi:hypothetical protein IU450_33245 [Nocardia abscessus]|uniref:hypothetical protein n=1 Tax=Nocardia abscessus TaxID=120957 RepID=UPI0018946973|nr:hypothetical protein [Nocardia abscessus]MBF6340724.1 hypothetical protein [Nocardia abscessus]